MLTVFYFLLGSICGSFFALCADRLPRRSSIVAPPSQCNHCQQPLLKRDLIPLFSFFRLRGRCRHCQETISPLTLISELLTASLFALLYQLNYWQWEQLPWLLLIFSSLILSLSDWQYLIVESRILYGTSLALLVYFSLRGQLHTLHWREALLLYLTLSLFNFGRTRLGQGDIRLLAHWTLFLNLLTVLKIILLASTAGLLVLLLWRKTFARHSPLPFVPFLSFGLLLSLLWA